MFFKYIWNTISNNKLPITLLMVGALVPYGVFYHRSLQMKVRNTKLSIIEINLIIIC